MIIKMLMHSYVTSLVIVKQNSFNKITYNILSKRVYNIVYESKHNEYFYIKKAIT